MRGAIIVIISVALVVWAEGDTKKDSVNTTFTDEALLILEECKNVDISLCFKVIFFTNYLYIRIKTNVLNIKK